ncbi:putative ribonuclease H-like domain-containing protein [Tanacetum coccineum]
MDKCKTRLGYNAAPPPYIGNFMPQEPDLVYPSLDNFVDVSESVSESIVKKPTVETNEPKTARKENGAPIIEDWISDSDEENVPKVKKVEMFNKPSFAKINFVKSTEQIKSRPMKNVINNAYSTARRPFNNITIANNCNFTKTVNTVKGTRVNTARPKAVLSAVKGNKGNAVKASACWILKKIDEGFVAFGVPRKDNMYSVDLKNIVPQGGLTCLFAKATPDESNLWHKRLGHVNFKTMNKLVRVNLVRGLPSKLFEINQTCVAYQKGKKHRASYLKVKVIRCDNGTEFKNRVMNQFCEIKGIKREFSVARTPQQNKVSERKNRTLIEAARTMLVNSKLPTTFWAEAVTTACYVQNMVLVIKPHNKTPYELFLGRKHALSFMRPFRCPVTIINTIDHLGKFDGKPDEGFFVGYSTNSKAFREFISRTRMVEENLHAVVVGNQSNGNADTKACDDAGKARVEIVLGKDYILVPLWTQDPPFSSSLKDSPDAGFKPSGEEEKKDAKDPGNEDGNRSKECESVDQEQDANVNNTNNINTVSQTINAAGIKDNVVDENIVYGCDDDPNMPYLEKIGRFSDAENDDSGADINNLDTYFQVSSVPTTRIHKDLPLNLVIGDLQSATQTRQMTKNLEEYGRTQKGSLSTEGSKLDRGYERMLQQFKNKKDERGIMIKYKARLVAQGYTQEEGIDYDEDIKSAFLYEKIEKDVYVCQPLGFEDPDFPDRESPFDLVAYTDSDYAGASLDRKSTTGGCQFLGCRLISWHCKKQIVVANSTTKAEYIAASNYRGQEVDIIKKTENQAKMTKLSIGMERLCKIKPKTKNAKFRVNTKDQQSKPSRTEEYN